MLITVEILTKEEAQNLPAGLGRSEPNANPYLPPPTGRLKLVRSSTLRLCLGPAIPFLIAKILDSCVHVCRTRF